MKKKQSGVICSTGMCPYIPCQKFPQCNHIENKMKEYKEVLATFGHYCFLCSKPMKKVDKHTWKTTCGHLRNLRLSMG